MESVQYKTGKAVRVSVGSQTSEGAFPGFHEGTRGEHGSLFILRGGWEESGKLVNV